MNTTKGINEIIKEYLGDSDISQASNQTYKRTLSVFVNWAVQNGDIKNLNGADIIRFKAYLINSNKSELTIDSYIKVLKLFFNYCKDKGYIDTNIAQSIHRPKRFKGHRKGHLTTEQVNRILSFKPESLIELRNYAIINLMVRTGLRCIEVSRLNVEDFITDASGSSLRIQRKGHISKDTIIGITYKSQLPIENYLVMRGEFSMSDPLFCNLSHHIKSFRLTSAEVGRIVTNELIRSKLKSKQITPHSLRHTAAVRSLIEGATVYDVCKMLGHVSIETTQIYLSSIEAERIKINPASMALDSVFL